MKPRNQSTSLGLTATQTKTSQPGRNRLSPETERVRHQEPRVKSAAGTELILHDEISKLELDCFVSRSLDTLCNLQANDTNLTLQKKLMRVVELDLPSFVELCQERDSAQQENTTYKEWCQKLIRSHQNKASSNAQTLRELTLQCYERSMGSRLKAHHLRERVQFLVTAVPSYLKQLGAEVQLPAPVVARVAETVEQAMQQFSKR